MNVGGLCLCFVCEMKLEKRYIKQNERYIKLNERNICKSTRIFVIIEQMGGHNNAFSNIELEV